MTGNDSPSIDSTTNAIVLKKPQRSCRCFNAVISSGFLQVSQTMGETSWIREFRQWVRQQMS